MTRTRWLALAIVVCVGCSPAATPFPDGGTSPDAPAEDVWTRPPRTYDAGETIYRACATSADCADAVLCSHDFPHGACTPACTTSADCPEDGLCDGLSRRCFRRCASGGAWCRDDQVCINNACFASCSARDDMPELACPPGSGSCLSNYCTMATPGPMPIGAPCTTYRDCVSLRCQTEDLGWPGGMCVRGARMPAADVYLVPGPMPSDRCPDAEALGTDGSATEGELGYCLPRCTVDDDCRDGYRCERRGVVGAPLHTDGYCIPWGCGSSDVPCAPPRSCMPLGAPMRAVCMRGP